MALTMAPSFEEFDDDAWAYGEELFQTWKEKLYDNELYYEIVRMVKRHRLGGDALEICAPQRGAFNVHYRIRFAEGADAIIRFPIPAYFRYAQEKTLAEVAVMRYISDNTTIPLPFVLRYGTDEESPKRLGPFIVMEWVENTGDMIDVLNTPGLERRDAPVLDPNINEETLKHMYSQMADVLLQLSQCRLPSIGSLGFSNGNNDEARVVARPLSLNIAQLANFARVPHSQLPPPSTTFNSSTEYYSALAEMHFQQLLFQRNQAIDSADDCRKKYIARQLFRKLASESRLANDEFDLGPFMPWCDDLRPANVLVDKDHKIAAIVDWEFTYAAPADFSHSPPWWLLLKAPEDWEAGLDDWVANYEPRLAIFLRTLEAKEKNLLSQGRLQKSEILSTRMRQSWESGRFWITYAARKTWAFDGIFWKFLDEKFFGKNEDGDFKQRLNLLPLEQVNAMERFVERKLTEKAERTLVDWYEPSAESKGPQTS